MDKPTYIQIKSKFDRLSELQKNCKDWWDFEEEYGDFESLLLDLHNQVADEAHLNNAKLITLKKEKQNRTQKLRPSCRSLAETIRKVDHELLDIETPMLINESLLKSMEKKLKQYNHFSKFLSSYYFRESQGILRTP